MSEHQPRAPQETPEAQLAAATLGVSKTRRNLLRAGAIGAPSLVALKATPVMACNCKLPSGFSVSGNQSRNGGNACAAPGRKPSDWVKTSSPYAGISGSTKVSALKGATSNEAFSITANSAYDKTVAQALALGDSNLLALFVAVYLEAKASGGVNFPSTDMVVRMWNRTVATSVGYTPTSAATPVWYKDEVTKYLRYLTGMTL